MGLPLLAEVGATPSHVARAVPWHGHTGWQLLFLLRGTTAYEFRGPRSTMLDVPGGHFLLIPPGLEHRGAQDMRPPCILLHLVLRGPDGSEGTAGLLTAVESRWLFRQLDRAGLSVHQFSADIQQLVVRISRDLSVGQGGVALPLRMARMRVWLCELLLESAAQLNEATRSEPDDLVQAVATVLRGRLSEKLRMSEVARSLGVTRARLFDQFKRGTGMTPNDYLLHVRVEKARELMVDRKHSNTEVAHATGFGSSQYFSTVFRRYTGQTPRAFRQASLHDA